MPNSGPPFYATDAVEAARAQQHQLSARRKAAYQAQTQVRLLGSTARRKTLENNWMPIIQREER